MAPMYTGIACFVLFDARGTEIEIRYIVLAAFLSSVLMLCIKYVPSIFHRPQLVDSLCNDILGVAAHVVGVSLIRDPILIHACALHSACFCLQNRFNGHAIACLLLLGAYCYGPRVTDVSQFVISVAFPHALEVAAKILEKCHAVLVLWMMQM
jgi:hypothetical protein